MKPNKNQKELIESTEGVYLVDAGAGTGKTFSITRRYIRILEKGKNPEEIFLATFTRNAAEEMAARIAERSDLPSSRIFDAPISTFHAHCRDILRRKGFDAPVYLGLEDTVPSDFRVLESRIRELQEFSRFLERFRSNHPEYFKFYTLFRSESQMLDLLKSLASKGVIPEQEGWFRGTESYLDGSYEDFQKLFKEANSPQKTAKGERQSELRRRLYSMKWKTFQDDAPDLEQVRGDRGTKQVRRDFCKKAFEEDRDELKRFVHDLYLEYMKYCLERNYLNFSFIMVLAFVLLHEDKEVRTSESFEYLMVDEFQDTNEIQFKLSLMLASEPNIAAVGDWKQSIYSFQHASVDNILEFEDRLESYVEQLNEGEQRAGFDLPKLQKIELEKNYRSSQEILDNAESALSAPASEYENPDVPETVSLKSETDEDCEVWKFSSEEEVRTVLSEAVRLAEGNYTDHDGEDIGYGDIAVMARTRNKGLEIRKVAQREGIPVAYEGGIELFTTRPALLALAWLRILASDSPRGWAVILEEAGYGLKEAKTILNQESYPDDMVSFREDLDEAKSVTGAISKVFDRYGVSGVYSDRLLEVISDSFSSSSMNLPGIVEFMEENIEEGETYQVEEAGASEKITVQTVHAAKGLEYPAVFVAGMEKNLFPSTNSDSKPVRLMGPAGLRQTNIYEEGEYSFELDSWRSEIISKCLSGEYNEERRLLYVAMTRAEKYLCLSATEGNESSFYKYLDIPERNPEISLEEIAIRSEEYKNPEFNISEGSSVFELAEAEEFVEYLKYVRHAIDGSESSGTIDNIRRRIDEIEGQVEYGKGFYLKENGKTYTGRVHVLAPDEGSIYEFRDEQNEISEDTEKRLKAAKRAFENDLNRSIEVKLIYI